MRRLSLLLCAMAACGERAASPVLTARGWTVGLLQGSPCAIEVRQGSGRASSLALAFGGSCDFIRDHKGEPRTYVYSDAGPATVLVAVGEIQNGCGPVSQGILIRDRGVSVSNRVARGSQKCPASGLDEKEFWMFAHR